MNNEFEQQWLGDLPADWTEKRADFLCNPYRITIDPAYFGDSLVAHYSIPQVQETGGPKIEPASDIESSKLFISAPTLLVSKLNPRKKTICIANPHPEHSTLASGEFVAINSNEIDRRYAYYLWCSEKVTDRLSAIVQSVTRSHQRVNPSDILKLPWKWPPFDTQRRIARFLDEKTGRIDGLIEKKRELLDRLAEKRQALITRAVTKGLNPDVQMKPSGIDWLGDIPTHWDIVPLRWYLHTSSGEGLRNEDIVDEPTETDFAPVIGGNGTMGFTDATNSEKAILVIGRVGAHCGNVHPIDEPSWITDNALRVNGVRSFDRDYLLFTLRTRDLNALANRNAQPLMTGETVKAQYLPCPPASEQQAIGKELEQSLGDLEDTTARIIHSVQLLSEYRSAFISAAVTGQLK